MNKPRRAPRRQVDGVLLFDKPSGMTSNAALQKVRWLFNAAKGGHTGTLDPMATGLLPLCLGEATKFAAELLEADKRYRATIRFGITTDTADADGRVLASIPVDVSEERLRSALALFKGKLEQIPPMHSALKVGGKPLYAYAREGIEIERTARLVTVHSLDLLAFDGLSATVDVACSKGTYVRTLASDLGTTLGCGAHLSMLRRTGIGALRVDDAVALEFLEALPADSRDSALSPPDSLLSGLPAARLTEGDKGRMLHGQAVRWLGESGQRLRLYGADGDFIGVGEMAQDGWLHPKRLVASAATR